MIIVITKKGWPYMVSFFVMTERTNILPICENNCSVNEKELYFPI